MNNFESYAKRVLRKSEDYRYLATQIVSGNRDGYVMYRPRLEELQDIFQSIKLLLIEDFPYLHIDFSYDSYREGYVWEFEEKNS